MSSAIDSAKVCPPKWQLHTDLSVYDLVLGFAQAADFAARKHRDQRRKDKESSPYINHPIGVAKIAIELGGVTDIDQLRAALLHDTIEDTDTTYDELVMDFGERTAKFVLELTDDKSLPKAERKRAQIKHVADPNMSAEAKVIKMCDKLYNLRDLINNPPPGFSLERIQGYCVWARMVLSGARGLNAALEKALDDEIFNATFTFEGKTHPCCPEQIDECHVFPTK